MRAGPAIRALAVAALVGAMAALLWCAGGALPTPPLTSWTATCRWYASVGPDVAVASLIRVGALGVVGWLLVATTAQLIATASASVTVHRTADLIAPRSLQRFVQGLAGVSLSAGLAVAAPGAGTPAAVAPPQVVAEPPPGTATLHLIPDPAPAATPTLVEPLAAPDIVIVAPGDSLWSIAEEALADAGAGHSDDRTIERYWRRLVDANREMLVDPGNADLIYPGQTVTLPIL